MKITVGPCWKDKHLFRLYVTGIAGEQPVGPRLFKGEVDRAITDTPYVYHTQKEAQAGADKLNEHFAKHMEARATSSAKSAKKGASK